MRSTRLAAVADINARVVSERTLPDEEILYADLAAVDLQTQQVEPRLVRFSEAPSRARRRVRPGDSLVPYLTGGSDWVLTRPLLLQPSNAEVVFSTGFYTASPTRIDPRFLNYVLASKPVLSYLEAHSSGVTLKCFSQETFSKLAVPLPGPSDQVLIAHFLDNETARIDALVTKKRRMIDLLSEKRGRCLEAELASRGVVLPASVEPAAIRRMPLPTRWRVSRLGSVLRQLTNGYVGPTRDILRDAGVRYIQGLHLKGDRIDFDRRPFYVDEGWHRARPRTALRPGDVLVVQTGDIGRCAVVPPGFGDANCHALLIARPNLKVVSPEFLGTYLQSDFGYRSLIRVATGALHPHLEFGIRDVPIVLPPIEAQTAVVESVQEKVRHIDSVVRMIERQIELSLEHRQALITAAVTGDLEVPEVAA